MGHYVDEWLKKEPPPELWEFLTLPFLELKNRYGMIRGKHYGKIKLIPVSNEEAARYIKDGGSICPR